MLRKFRIRTRLLLSFSIVVFFTFIVGLTGFISLGSIGKSSVKTIHNVSILNDIYDNNVFIDTGVFNMLYISDSTLTGYVVQTTKEHTEHLLIRLNEYVAIQDQFSDVFTPGEMQDMENLLEIYKEAYIPAAFEIFDLVEQGRREEALSVYINRLTPIYNTFTYYLNVGFIRNLENSDAKMKENNEKAAFNAYLMLILVEISLIVSVVLALAVTRSIAVPLSGLGEAAEKVANGNTDVLFEQSRSKDEIAQLSLRLQQMLHDMNHIQKLKLEAIKARHEKEKAEASSKSKDEFLAKMSHEIRTPMNAIMGMAEIALREEKNDAAREHIFTIKQVGANLLSIINDILDFSKIESGKLEIVPVKYLLSSLINDTINIIRIRLIEKPLRFFTNIEGDIPNGLIGDETRLRQILLNFLSNAVKYSEKGHIGLTITAEKEDDKKVWLRIAVSDTGKGIKPEDRAKLFDEFVKVDEKQNQGIEGTGLGLAITKRLCDAMGGELSMKSAYGKGSVFTVVIPQGIESNEPFAMVEEPEKKKVLVYERRTVYAESVCWTLENLGVPYVMVTNQDDFAAALYREEWFYVFSGYGLYEKIQPLMESGSFPKGRKPPLALMKEWGALNESAAQNFMSAKAYIQGVRFLSIPAQSLSIANILNGKADSKDFNKSAEIIRFTFPGARLLVVDDIATNLKVVEGLLAPYHTSVDTCLNGLQAIELVKRAASQKRGYDIVFMDHMMPEMDGMETTAAIRSWEKEQQENYAQSPEQAKSVPIIALTANAVVGMREVFLENGFNDFLSKPIDISKLDEMLNRWIPKEKREKGSWESGVESSEHQSSYDNTANLHSNSANRNFPLSTPHSPPPIPDSSFPAIPGVDTAKGIAMTGGTVDAYTKVLAMFCKDAEERLLLLEKIHDTADLPAFITHVHALKSASASVGAEKISAQAAELEAAGKSGDTAFIRENLPDFVKRLSELAKNIQSVLEPGKPEGSETAGNAAPNSPLPDSHSPLFEELAEALKKRKPVDIERIIAALNEKTLDMKTREALEKISDAVLMTEFDNALKIIEELLNK